MPPGGLGYDSGHSGPWSLGGTSLPPLCIFLGLALGWTPGPLSATCGSVSSAVLTPAPPSPHTEKKCYRESCISDVLELDLDLDPASRASPGSPGSGDNGDGGWRPPHRLSLLSSGSHCSSHSSGIEADSQLAGPVEPGEMSVDEPFVGAAALRGEEPPCSSSTSQSSRGTVGGGRGGPEGDTRDQGEGECAAWLDAGWVIAVHAGRGWGARDPGSWGPCYRGAPPPPGLGAEEGGQGPPCKTWWVVVLQSPCSW